MAANCAIKNEGQVNLSFIASFVVNCIAMRFGGVMGLHVAYPDLGFIDSSLRAFNEDEDAISSTNVYFPSPKLHSIFSSNPAPVAKNGKTYAHRSVFLSHDRLQKRLKKTLYYGKHPKTERPSLPMTGLLVNLFAGCGIQDSLERLDMDNCSSMAREACISPHAVIMALIYIERLSKNNPEFLYSIPSSHLFLVTTMVASKFLYDVNDDEGVYNDEWAKSAKLELEEVNKLEIAFLSAMDWSIFVSDEEFDQTLMKVEKTIALNEGSSRGWFSVSDLVTLGTRADLFAKFYEQVVQQVASVFFVTLTTYLFAALTVTAAVIVGDKATQSLANLLDSSAPTQTASPIADYHGIEEHNSTDGMDSAIPVSFGIEGDLDDETMARGDTQCTSPRMWCELSRERLFQRLPEDETGEAKNGMNIVERFRKSALNLGRFSGGEKAFSLDQLGLPPLLDALDNRELPQSTRLLSK